MQILKVYLCVITRIEMFKNVLLKTIYEKRWFIVFWGFGVVAMSLLMMGFYHSFQGGDYDQILKNVPKSLQGFVGNLASLKTVPGYVSQEVFALRVPLLTLIMGVVLFTGLLAGDESEGVLQSLLGQPVTRLRVFVQKFLAGSFISLLICACAFIGVGLGLLLIHENMSFLRLVQAIFGVWLLTMVFATFAFCVGAITGKKGLTGSVAGLFTFGTYLITSFAPSVSGLSKIDKLSPFHYYNNPSIAEFGLKGNNVLILGGVSLILLIISVYIFIKRDIYLR